MRERNYFPWIVLAVSLAWIAAFTAGPLLADLDVPAADRRGMLLAFSPFAAAGVLGVAFALWLLWMDRKRK